jgi:hypothetical protein
MKRHLFLAIGAFALTAASQPLFAAEVETPALRERPAPAAERAPARERQARPARERNGGQRAAQNGGGQQASSQPSQSSWTGSQAGGFGGGNAGGGGFSDPEGTCFKGVGVNPGFIPPSPGTPACPQTGIAFNQNKTAFTGGASYETPGLTYGNIIIKGVIDVFGGKTSTTSVQRFTYLTGSTPFGPDAAGQTTTATYVGELSESTNSSIRAKVGVPIYNYWALIYATAGVVVGKTEGSFTYAASNFLPTMPCTPGASCATNVIGAASWSDTRWGFSGGGGVEFDLRQLIAIPGLKFAVDYTYSNFGSYSKVVPLVVTNCGPGAGLCSNGAAVISLSHVSTNRIVAGLKIGL